MNTVEHRLTFDLLQPQTLHTVFVKDCDVLSHEIVISLREGAKPYQISEGCSACLYASSRDTKLFYDCEVIDNVIRFVLPSDMAKHPVLKAEIKLAASSGAVLGTPAFRIISSPSLYSDEAVEAENNFSALLVAMAKAEASQIKSAIVSEGDLIITYADGTSVNAGNVKGDPFTFDDFTEEQLAALKGETGNTGEDGATWYYGVDIWGAASGQYFSIDEAKTGDYYLNTANGNVYVATDDCKYWDYITTIKGKDGTTWHHGTALTGQDTNITYLMGGAKTGDYYLNTSTGELYVCTLSEENWDYLTNIKGEKGESRTESIIGLSVEGTTITYIKADGSVHSFETQDTDTTYSLGTDEVTGLTKLYATTGSAEDGTMTQKAIKTELDKKVGVSVDDSRNTLIFTI